MEKESRRLAANYILKEYLSSRMIYKHFRCWKTNGRRIGILLPVSVVTLLSSAACDYQISSKLDHRWWSYDIISIFQDGGHGVANLHWIPTEV